MKHLNIEQRLQEKLNRLIVRQQGINRDYIFNLLRKNPLKYLRYPYLFNTYFDLRESEQLDNLAIGGFLYYMNLLNFDHLFDTKDKETIAQHGQMLILGQFLIEESIKLFTDIFPSRSSFWRCWNGHKKQFLEALRAEKKISSSNFSWEDYGRIANGKVAFAKGAIDACYLLSRQKDDRVRRALLDSHYEISIAAQICDDISDVRKDFRDQQFNVAIHLDRCRGEERSDPDQVDQLVTRIYQEGVARELFDRALEHVATARQKITDLPKGYWHAVIDQKEIEIREKKKAIEQFFYIHQRRATLAQEPLILSGGTSPASERLRQRIAKAGAFLLQRLDGDNWSEYITQAGLSNVWSTAYITHQLAEAADYFPAFSRHGAPVRRFLHQARRNRQALWGYSDNWSLRDADSTNFALLALGPQAITPEVARAFQRFQNFDGGMRTYYQEQQLATMLANEQFAGFAGWTQSHACVSAVSLGVVGQVKSLFAEAIPRLVAYCRQAQQEDAYWSSYWWTDDLYATHFCYRNLRQYFPEHADMIRRTIDWVIARQQQDGAFADDFGSSPFYTALAIKTLCSAPEPPRAEIRKAVTVLEASQLSDGSWAAANALLVPAPDRRDSREHTEWPIRHFGVDIRSPEFQRLFTTATCLSALAAADRIQ